MEDVIKVMLVEDNREYRNVVTLALGKVPGVVLVGQFSNAEMALRHLEDVSAAKPDIALLDLSLPGMNGIDAIPLLRKVCPGIRIIMLTQSDREADVLKAIALGASGYLLKSALVEEIVGGIQSVMKGGAPIDTAVAGYILNHLKARLPDLNMEIDLSARETEILRLLSEGLAKKEIANRLSISYTTVDTHVRHIYEKLHVCNAPAAVSKAYRLGIFTPRNRKE